MAQPISNTDDINTDDDMRTWEAAWEKQEQTDAKRYPWIHPRALRALRTEIEHHQHVMFPTRAPRRAIALAVAIVSPFFSDSHEGVGGIVRVLRSWPLDGIKEVAESDPTGRLAPVALWLDARKRADARKLRAILLYRDGVIAVHKTGKAEDMGLAFEPIVVDPTWTDAPVELIQRERLN